MNNIIITNIDSDILPALIEDFNRQIDYKSFVAKSFKDRTNKHIKELFYNHFNQHVYIQNKDEIYLTVNTIYETEKGLVNVFLYNYKNLTNKDAKHLIIIPGARNIKNVIDLSFDLNWVIVND